MKISIYSHSKPEVDIIEIKGKLAGRGAVRLEKYLYSFLDEDRRSMIINMKYMKTIDGLGLNVLENFINRGMRIRIFNAGLEMLKLLRISEKEDIIKLYNCREPQEAILLFEKEMLEEKSTFKDDVKGRYFQRVNTSLQAEFKVLASHNDEVSYRAVIENFSEGGILVNIIAYNKKKENGVNVLEMVGKELRDINFSLKGGSKPIETNGECVWETSLYEERYAGIRFKDIKQNHKKMIKDYVYKQKNN